jgi:aminoglycoside phosphotransferase (APT) family kinase protein
VVIETADLEAVRRVLAGFVTDELSDAAVYGTGHIHDTFLVRAGSQQLIVQRLNERVFSDIAAVMSNVARVTEHARERLAQRGAADLARRVLHVRRARTGETYLRDDTGAAFRVFDYVTASRSMRTASDARVAFEAARAYGEFVADLRDLPAPALAVTIPGFHDTAARLSAWRSAYASDPLGRARELEAEWTFLEQHAELASAAARHALPLRVTHNDAKLDNVLFDAQAAQAPRALCVVDLDTVMPGYLAYDFGDLVRTTACVGDEDSRDLARSGLRLDAFEALARGYLQEVAGFLEPSERATLVDGALWILLELGLRFLTDHVLGDRYFKIARPNHNLDRARVQLHLVRELERELDVLRQVCARSG